MIGSDQINGHLIRARWVSGVLGIVFLLLSLPMGVFDTTRFLQSYLFSYLFWLELTLGSMAMLMVGVLAKGGYFAVTRRLLEASTRTIYVMAVLFLPILLGVKRIYPWADATKLDLAAFAHKSIFFELTFFSWRAVFYFVSWMLSAYLLVRWLNPENGPPEKGKVRFTKCFCFDSFWLYGNLGLS